MAVVNVMRAAHNMTKVHAVSGSQEYSDLMALHLAHFHKVAKYAAELDAKYLINRPVNGEFEEIDIRTLPTYSLAESVVKEVVEHWVIKGSVHTGETSVNESVCGFHRDPLVNELDFLVNSWQWNTKIYLLLEIDGRLFRLIK